MHSSFLDVRIVEWWQPLIYEMLTTSILMYMIEILKYTASNLKYRDAFGFSSHLTNPIFSGPRHTF